MFTYVYLFNAIPTFFFCLAVNVVFTDPFMQPCCKETSENVTLCRPRKNGGVTFIKVIDYSLQSL